LSSTKLQFATPVEIDFFRVITQTPKGGEGMNSTRLPPRPFGGRGAGGEGVMSLNFADLSSLRTARRPAAHSASDQPREERLTLFGSRGSSARVEFRCRPSCVRRHLPRDFQDKADWGCPLWARNMRRGWFLAREGRRARAQMSSRRQPNPWAGECGGSGRGADACPES